MDVRRSKRAWLVDAGFTGAAVVLGLAFLLVGRAAEEQPGLPLGTELGVGAGGCLALLLFRRRQPIGLTLCAIPVGIMVSSVIGVTALALLSVAIHRSWRATVALAGLHILLVAVAFATAISDPRVYWESVGTLLALDAVLVVSGMFIRSQRLLVVAMRERARQAEQEHRLRVDEARHLERERLAREMHDVLAHRISLLAVHAGALEVRRDAPDPEKRAAGVIRQSAYQALEDLREVIGMLRDDPDRAVTDRPQPTLADLPTLVDQSRRAGEPVTLECRVPADAAVPTGVGRHAYRIVQEGLTNARKHAPGARVRVVVERSPEDGLRVEITNPLSPGVAAAAIPGAGAGLIGLRERVSLVGGRLRHGRTQQGDFQLQAWLPC